MRRSIPRKKTKKLVQLFVLMLMLQCCFINRTIAQVNITAAVLYSDNLTSCVGTAAPTNWAVSGYTTWRGTNQATGTSGGWYGNGNMSFLGSGPATNGNATWVLRNNTGYSITTFTLSFTARLWKSGSSSPTVSVSYSTSASSTIPADGVLTAISGLSFNDATPNIATGANMQQTVTGVNVAPGNYLFIRFLHPGGANGDNLGWDDVQFTPVIPNVNINVESPVAGKIYSGTTNNILQTYTINPIFSGLTFSGISVNTGGTYVLSDITATPFKLFYNTSNSLSGATQLGTAQAAVASGGQITFSGLSQSIGVGITGYIMLTVDVSSSAATNNNINVTTTSFNNINFTAVPVKNGTDPTSASNFQTIYFGASIASSGLPLAGNIGQSSTDNPIFEFVVTPLGGTSQIDFTSVTINLSGTAGAADMTNFKIVEDADSSGDYSGGDIIVSSSLPYSSTLVFSISGQTNLTAKKRFLLIGDVLASPTYGNNIVASINENANITVTGDIVSVAPYSGNTQTIVNTGVTSTASDYFRSVKANGNWTTTTTWESSSDNATWHVATLIPTTTNRPVIIQNGTTVTIDSNASVRRLIIDAGGTLIHNNGKPLTILNHATATEFTINGTYVLKGTMPVINTGAAVVVNNGGVVRVDDNTGGQSDDFARLTTVEFKSGSVFYWNTTLAFETDNAEYFKGPNYVTNRPIFRVSKPVDVGSNNPTIINGKFETYGSNPQFRNAGTKTFRDGFGGVSFTAQPKAKVTHITNSGTFLITGPDAVIDGDFNLNIDNSSSGASDLEITQNAFVSISGSPVINVGSSGASGADFLINGTVKHNGVNPVYLTHGNLILNGYIHSATTGTFQANSSAASVTNITVGSNASGNTDNAGTLALTTGFVNVNSFTMQRNVSHSNASVVMGSNVITNKLTLTKGIVATGNYLFTYNKTNSLTLPASYMDSYLCTCSSDGIAITPTGSNGFRIENVSGSSAQIFPVSTDFVSPNRMSLNMNNLSTDIYTVVVGKGDIGGTSKPRVNRIWYVSEVNTANKDSVTMRLYFTKRNWSVNSFGSALNDEIENGFLWEDAHFVQKDASNQFVNVATVGTTDVPDYNPAAYDSEISGIYTKGISLNYQGVASGINAFNRFSVVNLGNIILPVNITNIKAYTKGSGIEVEWTALNEQNIESYEVERSLNGTSFTSLGKVKGYDNGANTNVYKLLDPLPISGNNFYRIKVNDKNGIISYTNIVSINISKAKGLISVFPNPVQNKLMQLQLSDLLQGNYHLRIYNLLGQQVYTKTIAHAGGSSVQTISLPAFIKSGMYVVKLQGVETNATLKIFVE